jgi:endonuclease YncB( thermonuclease family)
MQQFRRGSWRRLAAPGSGATAFALATLLALQLLLPPASRADQLAGRIVGVIDGDTVELLTPGKDLVRVRLSGIDAPEKGQPFGQVAKRTLAGLVFDRPVLVDGTKRDRYGRLVGKVLLDGTDVNLEMVSRGLAWHFKRYEREQPVTDRANYARAEAVARAAHLGLWLNRKAVAPWDYRARKRQSGDEQAAAAAKTAFAPGQLQHTVEGVAL